MANITLPPLPPAPPGGGLGQKIADGAVYALQKVFNAIAAPLGQVLQKGLNDLGEQFETEAAVVFAPLYDYALSLPGVPSHLTAMIRALKTPTHIVQVPLAAIAAVLVTVGGFVGVFGPVSRLGQYEADKRLKSGRVNPAELALLVRRGELSALDAESMLGDQGFGGEYTARFAALTRHYPDLAMMSQMFFRGHVGSDVVKTYLTHQGMDPADADRVLRILPVIPGIQDLISMAVREAFSPEIIAKFGTHQDFPSRFGEEAAKQGLSQEWAMAYWAAHWALPSVTQGYEMLHRGVISQAELMTLLQTQDVMPFWRDKVLAVSYNPYTRVDIRRMYTAGILTRAQVKRSYLDGGYDTEHAENLTEWTVRDTTASEKDLVKSEVLSAYKKGLLDPGSAKAALTDMGYTAETIAMLLSLADYQKVTEKKAPVKTLQRADLTRAYLDGLMQKTELGAGLLELGYAADEVTLILAMIDAEQGTRKQAGNKDLAKSELETAYSKGIIDAGRFRQALADLGYDVAEIDFITTLADWKLADKRQTEEIEVIRQMYLNRYITRDQVIIKLGQSNLPDTQVQRMLYIWDIDYQKRLAVPTGAQLTSFAKAGILSVDRYALELSNLGYAPEHVEWFVAALAPKAKAPA
jgi:hypothetical protein